MFFETQIKVKYQETDQMGVAHHSVYPVWYEEARTNFIKSCLNISYSDIEKKGILFPLSKLNCKYIKPAQYEDILTIHTFLKNVTPVKLEFEYKIFKDNELINTGYTEHPFVSKDFKLINLKKQNLELYNIINSAYKN